MHNTASHNHISHKYSQALICEVVNQVKNHNLLLSEVAKKYGISSRTVYQWVKSSAEPTELKKNEITNQIASLQLQIKSLNNLLQMMA
ncbi:MULTISPECIES: transposase [Pseudomonadati]|jgi:transposase|uniref:transposase n=1 Tax=Shewanella aestuarii TaxID=1028752 RepID=UPI00166F4F96|nr:hypothetical protein GCM10009193_08570 [Shewanella aestuarii]